MSGYISNDTLEILDEILGFLRDIVHTERYERFALRRSQSTESEATHERAHQREIRRKANAIGFHVRHRYNKAEGSFIELRSRGDFPYTVHRLFDFDEVAHFLENGSPQPLPTKSTTPSELSEIVRRIN